MYVSPYNFHTKYFTFFRKLGLWVLNVEITDNSVRKARKMRPFAIYSLSEALPENLEYAPAVIVTRKISFALLFLHFCIHGTFTLFRTLQYSFTSTRNPVLLTANWSWVWFSCFGGISYFTVLLQSQEMTKVLRQWKELNANILRGT